MLMFPRCNAERIRNMKTARVFFENVATFKHLETERKALDKISYSEIYRFYFLQNTIGIIKSKRTG
jgi:hypothetical protein